MSYIDLDKKIDKRIFFEDGYHAKFYIHEQNGTQYLVKVFNSLFIKNREKLKVIKTLLNIEYNGINAFPIEIARINRKKVGYISNYYPNAVCFNDEKVLNIPHELRLKAISQVEEQLRLLHNKGYIVNDVRLSNNMIDPSREVGFMIDFEDMILEKNYQKKLSCYRFHKQGKELPPSKWEDAKKQFICDISLLLLQDLEIYMLIKGQRKLLDLLKAWEPVYEFARQLFSKNEILYFSEISKQFTDEEKVLYYKNKIFENNIYQIGRK